MEPFDAHIAKLGAYLDRIGETGQRRTIQCPAQVDQLLEGLPVRVGPEAGTSIILKDNTAVELGNPSIASCAFLLWTPNTSLVTDGRITLIGPDIPEAVGESLPFAQILLIGGAGLRDQHHLVLEQHYVISNQIEGYMIRTAPQQRRMWTRVSTEAVEKGFSLETLGRALIAIYKKQLPIAEAVEVFFVTSSPEHVRGLEGLAVEVQQIRSETLRSRFTLTEDGAYECTSEYVDCTECPDRPVCDDIRDLIRLRRKGKASQAS